MPTPSTQQHNPPKSWEEFEDICADLFSREWNCRNTTRNGRSGQRQNGVDIYGYLPNQSLAGVQCKGRRSWPPKPLTKSDINNEVKKAKKFSPPLDEFTIATTAPNDVTLQEHARKITARHKKMGLFSVHVMGWDEVERRLTQYHELVDKFYGSVSALSVKQQLQEIPTATAKAVAQHLENAIQPRLASALERDLENRFGKALHRVLFPEIKNVDEISLLAQEILDREYTLTSQSLRRRILLRAARSSALRANVEQAESFLCAAANLSGADSDLPARARIAEAKNDLDGAIRLLRDETDSDSRSTLFNILEKQRGETAALEWLAENKISVSGLTTSGVYTLAMLHLQRGHVDKMRDVLSEATSMQLAEAPYLLFLRAAVRLGALLARPEQTLPLKGVLFDVRSVYPILAEETAKVELDLAIADFNQFLPIAEGLGVQEARRIAWWQLTWCRLLHPRHRGTAMARLHVDMENPSTALSQLQFALAYDPNFIVEPIAHYLINREQLGGLDEEELRASLVLRLHGNDPRKLADFIAQHRSRLDSAIGSSGVASIEIEALARSGDATSARLVLNQNRNSIDSNISQLLEAEVAMAEGADPVAEFRRAYESTKRPEALRALIDALIRQKEYRAVAQYAEELYGLTNDPHDAVIAANAYATSGDSLGFLRIADAYPFVRERDPELARHEAWLLFEFGRLSDAKGIATSLAEDQAAKKRDLNLEIAIAVESGDWDALSAPLGEYLENVTAHTGIELIRVAQVCQALGQGPFEKLVSAAVQRDPDNPHVLIGAYTMVVEEGLEERRPEADLWFRRALDLSGPDGPVKKFELKELLSQQVTWNKTVREINNAVTKGVMPLVGLAASLGTTLVDIIMRNLLKNVAISDPRKRIAIPLFSGRRTPLNIKNVSRLALCLTGPSVAWSLTQNLSDVFRDCASCRCASRVIRGAQPHSPFSEVANHSCAGNTERDCAPAPHVEGAPFSCHAAR